MSRILVTGATGFIGSYVVRFLVTGGHHVSVLTRSSVSSVYLPEGVEQMVGDMRDQVSLRRAVQGVDTIVHLAGTAFGPRVSTADPLGAAEVNLWGTLVLLEEARLAGVKRFLFASTCMVYGDAPAPFTPTSAVQPQTPYALQKYQCELTLKQYAKLYGMETLSLRLFNVYGVGMHETQGWKPVTLIFLERFKQGSLLTVEGDGLQTRDFVHVEDVARAFLNACNSSQAFQGECLNVASGVSTSMLEFARAFGGVIEHTPARTVGNVPVTVADISDTQALLQWSPSVSIQEGIRALCQEAEACDECQDSGCVQ